MGYPATAIPEKIFFKIGEVCDLVGVQAHVLRYWETEFPMLSPQKNRSGQRTYRRRDVEIALRIKELLYDELFTIAGAKKKLQTEMREASRLKIVHPAVEARDSGYIQPVHAPQPSEEDFDDEPFQDEEEAQETKVSSASLPQPAVAAVKHYSNPAEESDLALNPERREALKSLAAQLLELREMLKVSQTSDENFHLRKY
jgi:DNA-binding transcriptional MerR regulator